MARYLRHLRPKELDRRYGLNRLRACLAYVDDAQQIQGKARYLQSYLPVPFWYLHAVNDKIELVHVSAAWIAGIEQQTTGGWSG